MESDDFPCGIEREAEKKDLRLRFRTSKGKNRLSVCQDHLSRDHVEDQVEINIIIFRSSKHKKIMLFNQRYQKTQAFIYRFCCILVWNPPHNQNL